MAVRPKKKGKKKLVAGARFGPAQRLLQARKLLATPHGATLAELQERCACGRHTAMRLLKALEGMGEAVHEEREDRRVRYRIAAPKVEKSAKVSASQVLALTVAIEVLGFLEGTSLKESFDEVVEILETSLGPKAFADLERLRKKVVVVPDAPWVKVDRTDVMDSLATGLLRGERVILRRPGSGGDEQSFDFEPYALIFWRQGIYVAGYSHHHKTIRTFGLDRLKDGEWKRGETFEPPAEWDARARYAGSFGLFDGQETRVKVRFAPKVARYVMRRQWMPDQRIEELADGHVLVTIDVRGTTDVVNWVLGFGEHAELLEPASVRAELAAITRRMAATYEAKP